MKPVRRPYTFDELLEIELPAPVVFVPSSLRPAAEHEQQFNLLHEELARTLQ